MFISHLFSNPHLFFTVLVLIVFSICCHEYMHAQVALWLGDSTAADNGHLTLSPFKQMGWISLIMLAFIGIAWGQVPVNYSRLRGKYGPVWVALAGPVTNLLVSSLFSVISFWLMYANENSNFASAMLFYASALNLVLFVFNMLPIPGFDGWHIIKFFNFKFMELGSEFAKGAYLILMMLLLAFSNHLYMAAFWVINLEHSLLFMLFK